jgi:hypothetical protein
MNVDYLETRRWDHYGIQDTPAICDYQ